MEEGGDGQASFQIGEEKMLNNERGMSLKLPYVQYIQSRYARSF